MAIKQIIIEYKIVFGSTPQNLTDEVTKYIFKGWQPLGSFVFLSHSQFAQSIGFYGHYPKG